ncbi:Terpene synthase metal-binding domain protein-like protein [Leptotrombidium deliense]|uniref:Terpene synthase n=1 Tax=Leptotrombidium deliense TaxID=299467 RepID=A0A443SBX0_9ACAR|nr:Terpene synthase metal-binding domain protein-like protein [Leptotrombidium deliense]
MRVTQRYIYPDFLIPCQSKMHPDAGKINDEVKQWSFKFKLHGEENDQYKREQMVKLACLCYPDGDFERTVLCAKFLVHIFSLDDEILHRRQGKFFKSVMEHGNSNVDMVDLLDAAKYDLETPVAASFADYWNDMKTFTGIEWQTRFAENYVWYLKGTNWEIDNLDNNRIPPLPDYLEYRHYASGIDPSLNLVELSRNIFIPDKVIANPTIQRLSSICGNVIAFANDVYSFEKERKVGEINNLVIVMKNEYNISYQEAIKKATDFVNEEMKKYDALEPFVPSFGVELDKSVKMYLEGFRDWMTGNLDWGLSSGRYRRYSYPLNEF